MSLHETSIVPLLAVCLPLFLLFKMSSTPMQAQTNLFNQNNPSDHHPLGHMHPDAPRETQQFAFMLGKFTCDDSLFINGEWQRSKAIWQTCFTLNGFALQDIYYNKNYTGTSIRYYDPLDSVWIVHFFGMPGRHNGIWRGKMTSDQMILKRRFQNTAGKVIESKLTFFDIGKDGFEWQSEHIEIESGTTTLEWKISATRLE